MSLSVWIAATVLTLAASGVVFHYALKWADEYDNIKSKSD